MKRGPVLLVLLAGLHATKGAAHAEEPSEQEEPVDELLQELFLGEAVYPQERGELQLTGELAGARAMAEDEVHFQALAELGITDSFQLSVAVPLEVRLPETQSATGAAGIELEAMWSVWNSRRAGVAFSTGMDVALPALTSGPDEPTWEIEPFVVAYAARKPLAVNLSVSLQWGIPAGGEGEHELGGEAALSLLFDGGPFVPVVEMSTQIEDGEASLHFASGFVLHAAPSLDLGVAGVFQVVGPAPDVGGVVSLTWEKGLFGSD